LQPALTSDATPAPTLATVQALIAQHLRTVADWPVKGVMFRDITPLLADARVFAQLVNYVVARYRTAGVQQVAGIDARGFILGAVIAHALGVGFIPIRKQGKLPFDTLSEDYALEYGTATLQIHADVCLPGARVLVVDDLIATGGSMLAACKLLQRLQASVVECAVLIDLPDLGGSQRLLQAGLPVHALCQYPGH
jgi:adenine phosphoribosyltransferase